jgi:hypothetical protein
MTSSDATVVLYKSSLCRHCTSLSNIWDKPPSKDEDSVTAAIRKIYPNVRFYVLTAKDNTGKFDENTAPKDLIRYGKWYPMILLVPGKIWNNAMSKLGPKTDAQIVDGVQIMNGIMENGELKYVQKYDIRKPSEFARWIKDCLENEDFKRVQNNTNSGILVPTIPNSNPIQPIPPLLSKIVRPGNTSNSYSLVNPQENTNQTIDSNTINGNIFGDICSLRIISRPR